MTARALTDDDRMAWVPMYWADFFEDTEDMEGEEVGAYVRVMGKLYRRKYRGYVDSERRVQQLAQCDDAQWSRVRSAVMGTLKPASGGGYYHKRVVAVIAEQVEKVEHARRAANARWGKDAQPDAQSMPDACSNDATASIEHQSGICPNDAIQSQIQKQKIKDLSASRDAGVHAFDFESVYAKYPRKIGKAKGIERAKRAVKTADDYARLERAVANYAKARTGYPADKIKHFDSWMNSQWEDWVDPPSSEMSPPVQAYSAHRNGHTERHQEQFPDIADVLRAKGIET